MEIKKRQKDTNKSDYGRIALVGGSAGMAGSIYMASLSALRAGGGLVYSIIPETIGLIMQIKSLENIVKVLPCENDKLTESAVTILEDYLDKMDVVVIGPGMGKDEKNIDLIRAVLKTDKPVLIDADGLNSIHDLKLLKRELAYKTVLTPHPLEFSRLTGYSVREIKENPQEIGKEFSKQTGTILVLKGNKTLVIKADEVYINNTGNPGMATAGTGDCLSGIIGAFLYKRDTYQAAKLGVYVHGLAGDLAAKDKGEDGMIASDLIDYLPYAIKECKEK
ncbi:MAG: NAD(P)H-hydrate dehydratase [Finegoldia sp.]|nr:NAD(P)H-hydrate dehydratase [Finegoldia sp.]